MEPVVEYFLLLGASPRKVSLVGSAEPSAQCVRTVKFLQFARFRSRALPFQLDGGSCTNPRESRKDA